MKKCLICGGEIIAADVPLEVEGYVFVVRGERCGSCGEELIGEMEGQRMIAVARRLGIWGGQLKLHRKLSRSARGTVLRIPSDIEEELNLSGTENVAISRIGENKILIEIEGREKA